MKQAVPFFALAALFLLLAPSVSAQAALQVPYCPLFGSPSQAPTVSTAYTSSAGLPAAEYYVAYTTGSLGSPTSVSGIVTVYVDQAFSGNNNRFTQSSPVYAYLTVQAPVPAGTQINFYIGDEPSSPALLYLAGSTSSSNTITISSMPSSSPFPAPTATSCIIGSIPIVMIALLLSFALIGLSFMIGEVLNVSGFKNWYKGELWEVTKSVLIVVSIFAVLAVLSAIAYAFTGSASLPGPSGYTAAQYSPYASANLAGVYNSALGYIYGQLSNANTAFSAMYGVAEGTTFLKKLTLSFWVPYLPIPFVGTVQFGSSENLFQSSYIESDVSQPATSYIKDVIGLVVVPMIVLFQLLYDKLVEFALLGLTVFVPLGLVMRAIPFLRGIGGTMLAIGISISIVFPALLIAFNMPVSNYIPQLAPQSPGLVCNSSNIFVNIFICTGINAFLALLSPFTGGATGSVGMYNGFATLFSSNGASIYPTLNVVIDYAFPMILQFILLVFDIIFTYAIGDAIARMLGGSLKLGIGKFKVA